MSKILVHLISGQTMPVYIAHKIIEPDIDACLFTESSRKQYENIVVAFRNDIDEILVPAFDYEDIYFKTERYVEEILDKNDEVIFDFTGGTKIQSLALFNFAMKNGHKAIYINTQNHEYILFENYKEIKREKFNVSIHPETYLALGGFGFSGETFEKYEKDPVASNFLKIMEEHYKKLANVISRKKNNLSGGSKIYISKNYVNIEIYHRDALLFSYKQNNVSKNYSNFLNKLFAAGTWLEYLTYKKIRNSLKFDYVEANVKIPYGKSEENLESKNEIDVLAIQGVTPYVFECKTAPIKQEEITKLTSLRNIYFGRYCKLVIVGLKEITNVKVEKLKDNNIEYVKFDKLDEYLSKLNFESNPNLK